MASFRETRELLNISHAMGFITDAELLLLLYEESSSYTLNFPNKGIRHFLCRIKMETSIQPI